MLNGDNSVSWPPFLVPFAGLFVLEVDSVANLEGWWCSTHCLLSCFEPVFSATSLNFHQPPRYQYSHLEVTISLDMANLNMVNISSLDFHIWQHLEDHRNETWLWHLATIPSISVNNIYQHIISGTQHITPFNTSDESTEDTDSIWTLFLHRGIYVTAIGLLIPAGLGIFCCYFFWC